jgi:hypothetical protein
VTDKQMRGVSETRVVGREAAELRLQRRREINRESMRRRRAERAKSLQEQKRATSNALVANPELPTASATGMSTAARRCAICRIRDSVEQVVRLLPSSRTRSGYVQIRIPYCGCC